MALPDALTSTGLTIATASQLISYLNTGFQGIYGAGINVDSNSPDGQVIGIESQMGIDVRELLLNINASFDPDQAQGVILDQRVAINNITRIGGTYTIQPINITVNATVTLQGLDTNFNNPNGTGYTVQDGAGNQFILESTTTLTAGTTTCNFRAAQIGSVNVPVNTLVNPVTIINGVTSVNNPSGAVTIGQNQETDAQLRIRRVQSVALNTSGFGNGQLAQIKALPGVTEASFYQNNTGTTDANGTPAHTQWLIVAGGVNSAIANVIYNTINGAGMRGAVSQNIITPSGAIFTAQWDVPISENLYIQLTIQRTNPTATFNTTAIAAAIAAALVYNIGAAADTSAVTLAALNAINANGGNGVPVLVAISNNNSTFTDYLLPTSPQYEFTVSAANITITVV